jgi:hypothetical protein
MADLSITAASVVAGSGATIDRSKNAGAALTAGQVVYLESSSSTYKLADCNSATAEVRTPVGIALHAAASGQPVAVLTKGPVTIGATLTAGVAYYLSGTAGGIRPVADNTTGDYPAVIGMASSTTVLVVNIQAPGAVL